MLPIKIGGNMKKKLPNTVVGNIGLYYICYELSKRGWNVLPTSRNTRGVDLVIYNQKGDKKHTIQIKTLSKESPIPLGKNLEHLIADFLMVCVLGNNKPRIFILRTEDIKKREEIENQKEKGQKKGFWAVNSKNAWTEFSNQYLDNWRIIGDGF